jgi:multidrug efflux pump subunit AcrB
MRSAMGAVPLLLIAGFHHQHDSSRRLRTNGAYSLRRIRTTHSSLEGAQRLSEGAEVQRPLASVIIGRLFSLTVLTLFLLPLLYE